ncbi:MAG: transposase [Thermoplasmatales archaeon]
MRNLRNRITGKEYSMKENIRNLWNMPSKEEGKRYWQNLYCGSSIDAMKGVAQLMRAHIGKILNYFTHRITNARADWINSKIALIEKIAYGYRNKDHMKTAKHFM